MRDLYDLNLDNLVKLSDDYIRDYRNHANASFLHELVDRGIKLKCRDEKYEMLIRRSIGLGCSPKENFGYRGSVIERSFYSDDNLYLLKILFDCGCNPNCVNDKDQSLLHISVNIDQLNLARKFGADPNSRDNMGNTAIFMF